MRTRREIILGGLSSLLMPAIGRAEAIKSIIGGRWIANGRHEDTIDYFSGYTNLIEHWTPSGTNHQTINLSDPIVPLSDFTIDGCMTYHGSDTGDAGVLCLNENSSVTFSLWYKNGNIVPRCFATEGSANPVANSVLDNPTFCFSIRFDSSALTMTFASGDLSRKNVFASTFWTWSYAYGHISSGLTAFGMDKSRLSDINSIRVYPFLLTDEELLFNNTIDQERFFG